MNKITVSSSIKEQCDLCYQRNPSEGLQILTKIKEKETTSINQITHSLIAIWYPNNITSDIPHYWVNGA